MAHSLLLADDSPTIAKILGMALSADDYEIRSVLTAEEAIKELKAKPPFFFLVDLQLPGKNGYEFARLIRQDAELKQVRVLLLSSAFEPVDEQELAQCGADGVIAKPFNPGDLREKLRQIQNLPPKMPSGGPLTEAIPDLSHLLSGAPSPPETDANSILSSILGGSDTPPPAPKAAATEQTPSLDLSSAFQSSDAPPPAPPAAKKEGLSPNAQALAAFFSAEIDSHSQQTPTPPLALPEEPDSSDSFDASLSSIDWDTQEASLDAWSSPPPKPKEKTPAPMAAASPSHFLFDTGNSSFRFADDYLQRITRSFTGEPGETDSLAPPKGPIFPQSSSDQAATKPSVGGGAWTPEEIKRMEPLVREEMQMVMREIAEKIAWEVIPELAENLIRKELNKVLKQMEE